MEQQEHFKAKAETYVRYFLKEYLKERRFPFAISMENKEVSCSSQKEEEACKHYEEVLRFIDVEKNGSAISFSVVEEWYDTTLLNGTHCVIFGEFLIAKEGFPPRGCIRFSLVCGLDGDTIDLCHSHFSLRGKGQDWDSTFFDNTTPDYYDRLEKELEKRTELLKAQTIQLEALTNNIVGGVEVCRFDEEFTIKYISQGFTALTGYTKDEIATLFGGKHSALVYPPDIHALNYEIKKQLAQKDSFSVEYRIVTKEQNVIWIMDKGLLIPGDNGEIDVQCILSDISEQKSQEEALLLSEKRYRIAMELSDITLFEYNIESGELLFYADTVEMYGLPTIVPNGVETFVEKVIEPECVDDYLEMYRKIKEGEASSSCFIKTRDVHGDIHDFELILTNVFDSDGKPVRAIGVRRNVSQIMDLQREKEFGTNLALGKTLILEANITKDKLVFLHERWVNDLKLEKGCTYNGTVEALVENGIAPEHQQLLRDKLKTSNLLEVFHQGESLVTFSYKRKDEDSLFAWYEAILNIIKDQVTGDITMRFYHRNIHENKRKEQQALAEKSLYESMVANAKLAYEVNVTKNRLLKGHEDWNAVFDIEISNNYSEMIYAFSIRGIHQEDVQSFVQEYNRERVLARYHSGERQISCEYRKKREDGSFYWVHNIMHLYEDPETLDVKGFCYVEDIDEEKKAALLLKYTAEHDTMTGFYNKSITEQKINNYLNTSEGNCGQHAFFIVDIDYFKLVNDTFGHLFGDDVIKEIATKVRCLFREEDIFGRIGGDEFCVLMKNVYRDEIIEEKAENLCQSLVSIYTKDGKSCRISASVGIAIYNKHGLTYEELCRHADDSLYIAKNTGKNKYQL